MYNYKLEKSRQLKTLYNLLYQRLDLRASPQISLFQMMSKYYELRSQEDLKLLLFNAAGRMPRSGMMLFTHFSTVY